jgi:hypothetical protein
MENIALNDSGAI